MSGMYRACLLALAALALGVMASAVQAAELHITDDRGVNVTLPRSPQRIVSLLPSLTETVCALGQCQRLVGVDRYSNHPAPVRALPRVGGGIDPDIESIVALRPDLVLAATSSRGVERLQAFGLKVLALEPRDSAGAHRAMVTLGTVLDVPDAERIWRAIDAGVASAAQSLPRRDAPLRVYFEVSTGGYAAGPSSFLGELMTRLSVRNIVPADQGPFPRINPEFVVRADPDLIMIGERNAMGLAQRPGWNSMRALREQRLCVFTADESDVLVRPGPRMAEAAELMARCIREKGMKP
jgi:iron complex transport system substrate-binding protein